MENISMVKNSILTKINEAKKTGSGFGFRYTIPEICSIFGETPTDDVCKEILNECRYEIGKDFDLVMPVRFATLDIPMKPNLVSKIIVELIWNKIDQKKKTGVLQELTNDEVYHLFGFENDKNIPLELMLFSNDIDTMDPNLKFVRHTINGDVLYSTSEFCDCFKMFTYSGLSHKIVDEAWKKICDARNGNCVRFANNELTYIEASDLYKHRTKSFNDTETVYSVEEFFNIMPTALVKETAEDFDFENSVRFFLKLIYLGDSCVKYAPFIVNSDKSIFKQNVQQFGAKAVEELIKYIPKTDESLLNEINIAKGLMIRKSAGDLLINPIQLPGETCEMIEVKPIIFQDVEFLKTLFSHVGSDEKNSETVISIMKHSKEFCSDKGAVACAIGATSAAYNFASNHILPDKIIVLSIIKKYEEEIKLGKSVVISKKLLEFANSIACDDDFKLIIYALDEFCKLDNPDNEMRNAMISKIDQILLRK